jgi:hypothetical protein
LAGADPKAGQLAAVDESRIENPVHARGEALGVLATRPDVDQPDDVHIGTGIESPLAIV